MKACRKIIIFLAIVTLMLGTVTANAADISFEMRIRQKNSTLRLRGRQQDQRIVRLPPGGLVMLIRLIGAENEAWSMNEQGRLDLS